MKSKIKNWITTNQNDSKGHMVMLDQDLQFSILTKKFYSFNLFSQNLLNVAESIPFTCLAILLLSDFLTRRIQLIPALTRKCWARSDTPFSVITRSGLTAITSLHIFLIYSSSICKILLQNCNQKEPFYKLFKWYLLSSISCPINILCRSGLEDRQTELLTQNLPHLRFQCLSGKKENIWRHYTT